MLLFALPWLPPRLRRGAMREFRMTLHPGDSEVMLREGETILEAGLRAGIALPFECRNGACGKCKCTVLQGSVDPGTFHESALGAAQVASGKVLMCRAMARSDLEIEFDSGWSDAAATVRTYCGRVKGMARLAEDVMRVTLSLPSDERIDFVAGQYINVLLEDGQRRAFSFANPPHKGPDIELHIRLIPGGRFTPHVFTRMRVGDELRFEGPLGSFRLHESARPIIFVAGATGFAPIKSIVEDAFHRGLRRPMLLFWGVRRPGDLYMRELAEGWQREQHDFTFVPVLSQAVPQDRWSGRTGLVHEAILHDFPDLKGYEIYVCGSAKMVEEAFPAFLAQGLAEEFCFSDSPVPSAALP